MNRLRLLFSMTAMVAIAGASIAPTLAQGPLTSPGATTAPGESNTLWLDGPFGKVPGGTAAQPAPNPGERALDTWVRDAPIALGVWPTTLGVDSWEVTLQAGSSASVIAEGGSFDARETLVGFTGPATSGEHLLVARTVMADGSEFVGAWILTVPEREFPDDGVMDIPAPDLTLTIGDQTVVGERTDGCYLFLCVTIGKLPPASKIPAVVVPSGESLLLALTDGTPFDIHNAEYNRLDGDGDTIPIEATWMPGTEVELPGPPPGAWLLSLEVAFDRGRGVVETVFRLLPDSDRA